MIRLDNSRPAHVRPKPEFHEIDRSETDTDYYETETKTTMV